MLCSSYEQLATKDGKGSSSLSKHKHLMEKSRPNESAKDIVLETEISSNELAKIIVMQLSGYTEEHPARANNIMKSIPGDMLKKDNSFYYWLDKLEKGNYVKNLKVTPKHSFYWLTEDKGRQLYERIIPKTKEALLDTFAETLIRYRQSDKSKEFVKARLEELANSL